jgi:hypothetical protein
MSRRFSVASMHRMTLHKHFFHRISDKTVAFC